MTENWPKAEKGYVIERVDYPGWLTSRGPQAENAQHEMMAEQDAWRAAIPLVYRLLAAPLSNLPFPKPPWTRGLQGGSDLPGPPTMYWSPLLDILLYSLGWSRPDLGMKWWDEAGRPVEDSRLRLISDLWGQDGRLEHFLAWLWTSPHCPELNQIPGHTPSRNPVNVDESWLQNVARSDPGDHPLPYLGGTDPLHLGSHTFGPLEGDPGVVRMLHSTSNDRRAVFIADRAAGWYTALATHGAGLPSVGQNSWYVDVVVKSIGFLGTYRHSRETGLWFSGPHSLHVRGV